MTDFQALITGVVILFLALLIAAAFVVKAILKVDKDERGD